MKQNIYDDPAFFSGYADLRRNEFSLNNVLEEPAMKKLLPDLKGLRVLDMGCGTGKLCRYAAAQGAQSVVGVDISRNMLAVAEAENSGFEGIIRYRQSALEDFAAPSDSFDLAVSSLALHYVENIGGIFAKAADWLTSGGFFVFSVEHPITTAPAEQRWVKDGSGNKLHWPVDDYGFEGKRVGNWIVDGVVKYHRTLDTYINGLIENGFRIVRIAEPGVAQEYKNLRPDFRDESRRPPFLFVKAIRQK